MRIEQVRTGLTAERSLIPAARPRVQPAEPPKAPKQRPSHVLLGWRRLEAPVVTQILAAMPDRPALVPAEAAQRYRGVPQPPVTHQLAKA
jgi:hypothetical protein